MKRSEGDGIMDLKTITTEQRNEKTKHLDQMSALQIVTVMNQEDVTVPEAVEKCLPEIATAAQWAAEAFAQGGRLFYIGAGTSGRLGVLDAAECVPTFGVDDNVVIGIIAGGEEAMFHALEHVEDDTRLAKKDLMGYDLKKKDMVVGLAASGRTPYVLGGLAYAKEVGCRTVAIACTPNISDEAVADLVIEAVVGPEVLTGSTRLKAGTAQKLILNMISTASMTLSGKVYQNYMVDVLQNNEKLRVRAENIVMDVTHVNRRQARQAIDLAQGSVKTAITMLLADCSADEARRRLEQARGYVREAIVNI